MKSNISTKAVPKAHEIIERMDVLRASGLRHAVELRTGAKRVVDWKEYVRAKPILFVAIASLSGFGLIRSIVSNTSRRSSPVKLSVEARNGTPSLRSTIGKSIGMAATAIVSSAVKNYVASLMEHGKSNP
jgi:hypothetical protein